MGLKDHFNKVLKITSKDVLLPIKKRIDLTDCNLVN